MISTHTLGFPRIGPRREMKKAVEAYWSGKITQEELEAAGRDIRASQWQAQANLSWVSVGDFSWYDSILDLSVMLGVIPERFGETATLDTVFRMARGRAPSGNPAAACEMTKWFDTNYHYLVPEIRQGQRFQEGFSPLFDQIREAQALGFAPKVVLPGPLTWLWLSKIKGAAFERLDLLPALLPVYRAILEKIQALGVTWVQLDEPLLVLDLPDPWKRAFGPVYEALAVPGLNTLVATYFGRLEENLSVLAALPVAGVHVDAVRGGDEALRLAAMLPPPRVLSVGIVDGRNIWRTDLDAALARLQPLHALLGDRLWLAPSCSLLHVPVDLAQETALDPEIRSWLAFAVQKLDELHTLARGLDDGAEATQEAFAVARAALASRRQSPRRHRPEVKARMDAVDETQLRRALPYADRALRQRAQLSLPVFPTTTIGSFPQTQDIRTARRDFKAGRLAETLYRRKMEEEIAHAVQVQEEIGLDVLVHGEPERNDMVEYFGEQLEGFAFTSHGWVQSYGSRCVKPPILFGDVVRPRPMTVAWATYAQSLTQKPMKGMLTGPVTILNWSFVRDDQPRAATCLNLALALRDEVLDLEAAGLRIIQIDEAAFREGLPLRHADRAAYLDWAVRAFRVTSSGVSNETQIHTHMCYSTFNDIIEAVAAMDADVVTIETARSDMTLLEAFEAYAYPNEIGPGVYDIHSPNVPDVEPMVALLRRAARFIPADRLWVNPDCGLKTRGWTEVVASLRNMVAAARVLRTGGA